MSAWIGPVGGLVEVLQYRGSLSVEAERPSNSVRTLGGRVKVQRGALSRRVWDASVDGLSPAESANLTALELGGTPPWVWVDPYARVTNMFSPDQSVLLPGTFSGTGLVEGGSVKVGGVFSPRSVGHASGGTVDFGFRNGVADRPVVVPGIPVSVSAYVRGSGVMGLSWRDFSGAIISETTQAYSHGTLSRVSMANRTPPASAASVRVWVTGALQAAMPCLSWTPAVGDWAVGRGCNRVVVEGLSEAVQLASVSDASLRRSGVSFTVREVG